MLQAFNFFGQNWDTLLFYYSGSIISSSVKLANDYVILRGSDGLPLVFLDAEIYRAKTTAYERETLNYNFSLNGSFEGNADENTYSLSIQDGEVLGGSKDASYFETKLDSEVYSVSVDKPEYKVNLDSSIESGVLDKPEYSLKITSGEVNFSLLDKPTQTVSLNSGETIGIIQEFSRYSVSLEGGMDKAYKERCHLSFDLESGAFNAKGAKFTLNTGESLRVDFNLDFGAFYSNE